MNLRREFTWISFGAREKIPAGNGELSITCRNRHCPKCQSLARAKWLEARKAELLPAPYFHVVFTVPEQIAAIAYYNQKALYDILFQTTAKTLLTIGRDPKHLGADIGFFAILHTWGAESAFSSPPALRHSRRRHLA